MLRETSHAGYAHQPLRVQVRRPWISTSRLRPHVGFGAAAPISASARTSRDGITVASRSCTGSSPTSRHRRSHGCTRRASTDQALPVVVTPPLASSPGESGRFVDPDGRHVRPVHVLPWAPSWRFVRRGAPLGALVRWVVLLFLTRGSSLSAWARRDSRSWLTSEVSR